MVKLTKAIAIKKLADVPQEKQFWCSDGQYLLNLSALETALRQISDETFCYHSNETKCDFSHWVRDVIGDDKLANDLQKSHTQTQAAKAVANRVAWLKSKVAG